MRRMRREGEKEVDDDDDDDDYHFRRLHRYSHHCRQKNCYSGANVPVHSYHSIVFQVHIRKKIISAQNLLREAIQ